MLTDRHYEFCETDGQREALALHLEGLTGSQIGERLGISRSAAARRIKAIQMQAERMGYSPEKGLMVAQALPVSGTSTLYREMEDGSQQAALRWVKTSTTAQAMIEGARQVIADMAADVPRLPPVAPPDDPGGDRLLNVHVISDLHLGMYAWGRETGGEDWNTDKAAAMALDWARASIADAPKAKRGALVLLGDTWHYDSLSAVTPQSRHVLDSDTRMQRVALVARRMLKGLIGQFLAAYSEVDLIIMGGNHDGYTASVFRPLLAWVYEDEPRLRVEQSPAPYVVIEHGRTFLGFHHGDKRGIRKGIDVTLAGRFAEEFGRTKHRYAHVGHFHSHSEVQSPLMNVIQHETLAAPDAYSADQGYVSGRGAVVITYDDVRGEVRRTRLDPEYAARRSAEVLAA